ncbi:MAG: hypothetical protein AAF725_20775 [Acidobacteriota bacterium]
MENRSFVGRKTRRLVASLIVCFLATSFKSCSRLDEDRAEIEGSELGPLRYDYDDGRLVLTTLEVESLEEIGQLIDLSIFRTFTPAITPEEATRRFGPASGWDVTRNGERYDRWGDQSSFVDLVTRVNISGVETTIYYVLRAGSRTQPIDPFVHPKLRDLLNENVGKVNRFGVSAKEEGLYHGHFFEIHLAISGFTIYWHRL